MVIKFDNAEKISVPEGFIWDYQETSEDIGISYQQLKGRCPLEGQYLNKVCHEIYFIIKGTAKFFIKGEKFEVKERDIVVVEPNTPHYFETEHLEYITITRPNWFEEQAEIVK